jgi:DNA repair photolyase
MASERLFELRRTTFDTPHFRGITFIEAEAKSIINHVPGNYLPFNWTINAYRGCSHSCSYCAWGETPILMADGRTKPLRDVSVGDRIYGTQRVGNYRRYVITEVLAHWSTVKPAYRVKLADGTRLIASGEHRFLSDRGWKHVVNTEEGPDRAHLTLNNKLMGTGAFAEAPKGDHDFKRGYLCGVIRGDGHLESYCRSNCNQYSFRLAMVDLEALGRARCYLSEFGVSTVEFDFSPEMENRQALRAIRTWSRSNFWKIYELIEWPAEPSDEWRRGFLAGIFDAEGSYSRGILRIANTDPEIIDHVGLSLDRFKFPHVVEKTTRSNGLVYVRITGGLRQHLRFFHTTDPAITRKRTIQGQAIKNKSPLQVTAVEPLGFDLPMYDITTGTGDFIADGVVSHNCFARVTHTYMDMNAGRDFETKIVVKVNAPQLLRKELRAKRWKGESIAMGTSTDPYQRAEGKYRLTRSIIETLLEVRNPFSILTKGTLILRDLDVLADAAQHSDVSTAVSVGTLDEDAWRRSEPGTPHPRKRLQAMAKLNEAGVPCGVMVAPVLPGITDADWQIREVVMAAFDSGATFVSPILLHLRPHVREVYMDWLQDNYPDLVSRYEQMYTRAYASPADRKEFGERADSIIKSLEGRRKPPPSPHLERSQGASRARRERASISAEQLKLV